jgi:hypothetical protein
MQGRHDQSGHGQEALPDKFYKKRRDSTSSRLAKRIFEGPFDSFEEAAAHSYVLDDLDTRKSSLDKGFLMGAHGKAIPVTKGSYLQEDITGGNEGDIHDYNKSGDRIPIRHRIVPVRSVAKLRPKRVNMMADVIAELRQRRGLD